MKNRALNVQLGAIILLIVVIIMASSLMRSQKQVGETPQIQESQSSTATAMEEQPIETSPPITETVTESIPYISPIDFESLQSTNPDTIGWICIAGTRIDYPIVQTDDNDYYLNTSFEGNESKYGAIYLDYESSPQLDGYNNILYGHNMRDGSMFKDIVRFKDKDFFKEHQYFELYTPTRTIRLKAVSCYYDEAKAIARKTKFVDQESFNQYVYEMLSPSSFAEIPAESINSMFVLITCSYEIDDARTYLFAVEVDEQGELIATDDEADRDE